MTDLDKLKKLQAAFCDAKDPNYLDMAIKVLLDFVISEAEKPKERWRAEKCDGYWFVDSDGEVKISIDYHGVDANDHYFIGNYYRTKEEAQAAAERVRKAYVV